MHCNFCVFNVFHKPPITKWPKTNEKSSYKVRRPCKAFFVVEKLDIYWTFFPSWGQWPIWLGFPRAGILPVLCHFFSFFFMESCGQICPILMHIEIFTWNSVFITLLMQYLYFSAIFWEATMPEWDSVLVLMSGGNFTQNLNNIAEKCIKTDKISCTQNQY